MTGSASTNRTHLAEDDKLAAREEAVAWLASQLFWERRLRDFIEAKTVTRASASIDGLDRSAPVAAPATMSHDRDDLDPGSGVADGMEAVGSLA